MTFLRRRVDSSSENVGDEEKQAKPLQVHLSALIFRKVC